MILVLSQRASLGLISGARLGCLFKRATSQVTKAQRLGKNDHLHTSVTSKFPGYSSHNIHICNVLMQSLLYSLPSNRSVRIPWRAQLIFLSSSSKHHIANPSHNLLNNIINSTSNIYAQFHLFLQISLFALPILQLL